MNFLLCSILLAATPTRWDFEVDKVGELPSGWTAAQTGQGTGSVWRVLQDGKLRVLAQTSAEGPNRFFNLCVADATSYKNVELSVSLKAISGKNDQGGGLVWRYRDADNYYVARWNPLEDNFRVYKVVQGKRIQLETDDDVKIPSDRWHTIKITQVGAEIRCFLDDKQYLQANDDTFEGAGQIGLWTKSDAVTYFDDLSATGLE